MTSLETPGQSRQTADAPANGSEQDLEVERRWAAWLERGRLRNRRLLNRARTLGVLVAAALLAAGAWLAIGDHP